MRGILNSNGLPSRKSRRSAAPVGEDGATATAVATAAMTTPKASTTAADELAGPKHSAENMAKRRKRNPQASPDLDTGFPG